MKKLFFFFCFFLIACHVYAEDDSVVVSDINQIDIPTASAFDKYAFRFGSRLYSGGGAQVNLGFGIHDRLSLGTSFLIDGLIGNDTHIRMRVPEIDVKFRFWDGGRYIPAFALGYNGQGYFYDSDLKEYQEDEKGLYLVGTSELLPAFFANFGVNMFDFDTNKVYGFIGFNYTLEEVVTIMAEYDNLFHHVTSQERFNAGLRFHITPEFSVDVAVRDINCSGHYKNGAERHPERMVQLSYDAKF